MTLKDALEIAKKVTYPPSGYDEVFQREGVTFRKLGRGCSRKVYAIAGTPWVIKFGRSESEVDAILFLRTNPVIRRYLPGLIWFNETKTVVIMLRYALGHMDSETQIVLSNVARKVFDKFSEIPEYEGWSFGDLHTENIGLDKAGRLKVIDCGNFMKF